MSTNEISKRWLVLQVRTREAVSRSLPARSSLLRWRSGQTLIALVSSQLPAHKEWRNSVRKDGGANFSHAQGVGPSVISVGDDDTASVIAPLTMMTTLRAILRSSLLCHLPSRRRSVRLPPSPVVATPAPAPVTPVSAPGSQLEREDGFVRVARTCVALSGSVPRRADSR